MSPAQSATVSFDLIGDMTGFEPNVYEEAGYLVTNQWLLLTDAATGTWYLPGFTLHTGDDVQARIRLSAPMTMGASDDTATVSLNLAMSREATIADYANAQLSFYENGVLV